MSSHRKASFTAVSKVPPHSWTNKIPWLTDLYSSESDNFIYNQQFSFPQHFLDHMLRLQIVLQATDRSAPHHHLWKLPHKRCSSAKQHVSSVHLIGNASYFNIKSNLSNKIISRSETLTSEQASRICST